MPDFITKRSVPVLDEHVLTHEDEDGREVRVPIDARKLQEIADRNNRRAAETGDLTPIIIGHTKDEADESEQPEIVGYAGNFKVEPFARTGKKALTATFKFFRSALDKVRKYPRRSVELWLSDWKIDPIALLGATTPERDLGLLRLSRSGRKIRRIFYSHESQMTPTTPPAQGSAPGADPMVQKLMAALQQTSVWKWAEQQMADQQAAEMNPGPQMGMDLPTDMSPPPPDEFGDGDFEDDGWEDGEGDVDDQEDDWDEDDEEDADDEGEPVRYMASAPSGTNTHCPSGTSPRKTKMNRQPAPTNYQAAEILDRVRMAADQRRAEKVRYERALGKLQKENESLRLRFQRAERERDLVQLEAEGYLFDRVEELDHVSALSDDAYQKHLAMVRKRYQRAPIGEARWNPASLRSASPGQGRSRERCQEIQEYATQKGVTYQEALAELEGE